VKTQLKRPDKSGRFLLCPQQEKKPGLPGQRQGRNLGVDPVQPSRLKAGEGVYLQEILA